MSPSDLNPDHFPVTPEITANLAELAARLTILEGMWKKAPENSKALGFEVTSGLRSMEHHLEIYTRMNSMRMAHGQPMIKVPLGSKHLSGQAADVFDPKLSLYNWCTVNVTLLEQIGLWREDGRYTKVWSHFQSVAPASGKRTFIPY